MKATDIWLLRISGQKEKTELFLTWAVRLLIKSHYYDPALIIKLLPDLTGTQGTSIKR